MATSLYLNQWWPKFTDACMHGPALICYGATLILFSVLQQYRSLFWTHRSPQYHKPIPTDYWSLGDLENGINIFEANFSVWWLWYLWQNCAQMKVTCLDDKSILVLTAPSHYRSQCFPKSVSSHGDIRLKLFIYIDLVTVVVGLLFC